MSTATEKARCIKCGHNAGIERTLRRCKARIDGGEALCQCHCEFPSPQPAPDAEEAVKVRADHRTQMDWQQVALNSGPPCFYDDGKGWYCGRAERWAGHGVTHPFIPLATLVAEATLARWKGEMLESAEKECDELRKLLKGAIHAMKAYQYGNLDPTLATEIEQAVNAALASTQIQEKQ